MERRLSFQLPRGTSDILPDEQRYWRYFHAAAEQTADRFGYRRIDTPVFEDSGLFVRGIGEVTDIVEKETYTFEDRGGDLLTLRPEGTAPVCRAYLEHGMHNLPQPVRLYYLCPLFRYERPQAGRYRQHHQFGIEVIGDGDPAVDAEVIELGWRFIADLGLTGMTLLVNSIGDQVCRPAYLEALRSYYRPHVEAKLVCPDCQMRFDRNILRMLDCKRGDFSCQALMPDAPHTTDHLCGDCSAHWETLQKHLATLAIPFQVRGAFWERVARVPQSTRRCGVSTTA
ncbi:MAG: histidine--tRNA ligase [Chloroflexi bacterium]|nr:histidine--tRNA ligase [Chloroflexota bacterium]